MIKSSRPSLCFSCAKLVSCNKKYRNHLLPSSLYPDVMVIDKCLGYEEYIEQDDSFSVAKMAQLLHCSVRTMHRRLAEDRDKTLKDVSNVLGKEIITVPYGGKVRYKIKPNWKL